jgi:hypothetical protein
MYWFTEHITVEHGRGGVTMQLEAKHNEVARQGTALSDRMVGSRRVFGQRTVLRLLSFFHLF